MKSFVKLRERKISIKDLLPTFDQNYFVFLHRISISLKISPSIIKFSISSRMSKRSRSLKIHPPKYGDPFTNHLVENLAARLLFHFGQCAKLSGIQFPNSEESQTCSIGKRVTLRRPGASLERPSLDRIGRNSFNWCPSKWFLKIFRFQTNFAQFGFHPRQMCFIWRTIFISSNAVFFSNRRQFAGANDSSWYFDRKKILPKRRLISPTINFL